MREAELSFLFMSILSCGWLLLAALLIAARCEWGFELARLSRDGEDAAAYGTGQHPAAGCNRFRLRKFDDRSNLHREVRV